MEDSKLTAAPAQRAVRLWNGEPDSLRHISDSANQVYSFIQSGRRRYLRLTSSNHRTKEQLLAELDFIAHLRRGGLRAVSPVPSATGLLVEEIAQPHTFTFATVFEEAGGESFRYDSATAREAHFKDRGKHLGLLHRLSKEYLPPRGLRRFAWDEDKLLAEASLFLPESEVVVRRAYEELRGRLCDYPKSQETYGLIHGDFGETNYRYEDSQLNIFDFDDSCYHWFLYDLAVTIYPHGWRPEGLRLLDSLLEGYAEHITLRVTLEEITMFCQWRLVYMFLAYARKLGFERLSAQQSEWFERKRKNIARGYRWSA